MKKRNRIVLGLALLCNVAFASVTSTTATLSWTLPTTRSDGTALAASEIANVNVYLNGAIVGAQLPGTATSVVTGVCAVGTYSVTVVDTGGRESAQSMTVVLDTSTLQGCKKPPAAPSGIKTTVI